MTTPTPSYCTLPCTKQCTQMPQEISTSPSIYFLNNMPYCCYPHQPNILYPVYPVYIPFQEVCNENSPQRVLGEMVSAVGEVIENKMNSLENYVQSMEQQAVAQTQEKVKTTCFKLCSA